MRYSAAARALKARQAVADMEGAVPCALYASDMPYEGPMPPADVARGVRPERGGTSADGVSRTCLVSMAS